jgi:hypothetical protein
VSFALGACGDELVERQVVMIVDSQTCGTDAPAQLMLPCGAVVGVTVESDAVGVEPDRRCINLNPFTDLSELAPAMTDVGPLEINDTTSRIDIAVRAQSPDDFCSPFGETLLEGGAPVGTSGPEQITVLLRCSTPPGTGEPPPGPECYDQCDALLNDCLANGDPGFCDQIYTTCIEDCNSQGGSGCLAYTDPTNLGNL